MKPFPIEGLICTRAKLLDFRVFLKQVGEINVIFINLSSSHGLFEVFFSDFMPIWVPFGF